MCDCFHLAFPNWHAASSGTAGRRLRAPEPGTEDDSICEEPSQFTGGERPRPQGSSPVEEFPEKYTDSDKEREAEHEPHRKRGSGKKSKKSGLGSMFEKHSTPKMSKLKELPSPESGVIVKTAKDGAAEGLVYRGGGKDGIFVKEVVPESPASKSLKIKEGDQVLSATVYFDNMSYEDAIQILEHAQAYKVKLCLKRNADITETEPAVDSDVILEEDIFAPEMREQGKTKRRGEARISWPKFPSFGKGQKSRFARSHSSSEADEQRKLELSPTTSDTESPLKSQDAPKGKKKHKIKLSGLTKRGRISSSEDQDTDTPTTGQLSGTILQTHEESDMLSPECLESLTGETPEVHLAEQVNMVQEFRHEQNDQTLTGPQTVQHKVEVVNLESTLKTTDLTLALANKGSAAGLISPDGKKKRSELKFKILGRNKKKVEKEKSSPKRMKTLGASIEKEDQPENEKSDAITSIEPRLELKGDQLAFDANTQIISSETSRVISAKSVTAQMEMSAPKLELDMADVALVETFQQKGEEKKKKGKEGKQKTSPKFKLPKVGFGYTVTEETLQTNVSGEEFTTEIEPFTTECTDEKEDPYERLSKGSVSRTKLPKREDIEIPGMEDMSMTTTIKGIKEPKPVFTGQFDEIKAETVQMSIDVDSVKEAVSKLPGFKLPQVDPSGMPIPEEITVIDANAQRISVKTPTKVVETKTRQEAQHTQFDITSSETTKATFKLPKMLPADLTSKEIEIESMVHVKRPEKNYKESTTEITTEVYKQEDMLIAGKESSQGLAIIQSQETEITKGTDGITSHLSPRQSEKKSRKAKITTSSFGISKPDIKIPNVGIDFSVKGERTIFLQEAKTSQAETSKGKGQTGVSSDVKVPDIDGIEYIDSVDGSPSKKDGGIMLTGFGGNRDAAMPNADISFTEIKHEVKEVSAEGRKITLSEAEAEVRIPQSGRAEKEFKSLQTEYELKGQGSKFRMPSLGVKMPKLKGHEFDVGFSKKDIDVPVQKDKAEVENPQASEIDVSQGSMEVSMLKKITEIQKPDIEIKTLDTEGELDAQGGKFKMPHLGFSMPKVKGPKFDLSQSKKDVDVPLHEAKDEVKLSQAPGLDVSLGSADVSIPQNRIEIEKPDMEVKSLQAEGELDAQGGKFKMPHLGFSMPKVKGPKFDLSLSKKDVDFKLPKADSDVKLPEGDLGKIDVSIPEAKIGVKKNALDMQSLQTEGELNVKGEKVKMTKLGMKMPHLKGPEIDLSLSKKDADVTLPHTEAKLTDAPKIDILIPKAEAEVEGPELEIEGGRTFKMPKIGMSMSKVKGPEFHMGFSKKNVDVTLPEVQADVNLPDAELKEPSAKVDIKAPEIEVLAGDTEDSSLKFKKPNISFSIPKVKGPDIDWSLSKKENNLSIQKAKAEFKLPEVSIDAGLGEADMQISEAKMEVKKPEVEIKHSQTDIEIKGKGGKFKMPKFGTTMQKVKGPEIDLSLKKDGDLTLPEVKTEFEAPEAPKIDMDIKTPECEAGIDEQGGKFKMPKFGIAMPKVKGPDIDLKLSKKDGDVTLPEAKAEVKLPEAELREGSAEVKIKSPEIKVSTKDIEGSQSKFKMPTFKLPKFAVGTGSISADLPDTDHDIKTDGADLHITLPSTDVEVPKIKAEVHPPEVEVTGTSGGVGIDEQIGVEVDAKLKRRKFSLPRFSFSKQSVKTPEIDASVQDVNVAIPEADVEVQGKKVDLKPLQSEVEVDGQESHFKMPTFGITMPHVSGPEFDFRLSKKDGDVTLPECKAEVKLPDLETKKPSAEMEIKSPEIKISTKDKESSPSKFKMPTFKLLKFGVGMPSATMEVPDTTTDIKIEGADIQIPEEVLTVEMAAPSIETEGASIEIKTTETEHEGKGSKFKMPRFGVTMPKASGPEFDFSLSKKGGDVTLPEGKAEVKLPGVKVKDISAEMEIKAPEIEADIKETELSPSRFKMPTFKLPKFAVGTGSISTDLPDTDHDIKTDGADLHITLPSTDVEVPKIKAEVHPPEVEVTGTSGGVGIDEQIGVEVDAKLKKRKFSLPRFSFSKQSVKTPEIDASVQDVNVAIPEADVEVQGKKVDVKPLQSEVEVDGQESHFKMPTFGITMPHVSGPEFDFSLSKKDGNVTLPEGKAEVKLPSVKVKDISAEMEIKAPEIETDIKETELSPSRFKMPTFKLPKFAVGTGSISTDLPDTDHDIKTDGADLHITLPSTDVEVPKIKAEVHPPEVEVTGTSGGVGIDEQIGVEVDAKLKKRKFSLPRFSFSKQSVKTPEIDASVQDVNVAIPEADVEVQGKKVDLKPLQSEVEVDGQESHFKMPTFGITMPHVSGPEFDFSLSKKDGNVTLPEGKAEVKLPGVKVKDISAEMEIKAPEIETDIKETELSPSRFKMPTFKLPKFAVGTGSISTDLPDTDHDIKTDGADLHITLPSTDVEVPKIKAEVHPPEVEVTGTSGGVGIDEQIGVEVDAKLKKRKFSLPRFSFSKQSVKTPEIDASVQDVNVAIPEADVEVQGRKVDVKPLQSEVEVDGQESHFKMPTFGITMPHVSGPEFDFRLSKKDRDVTLPEGKAEVKLPDLETKEPSAEMEIKSPEIKVSTKDKESSPSKFKMPTFQLPKFGVGMPSATMEVPDTTTDIKIEGADIQIPEEMAATGIETEGASIDIKTTETEHEGKGSKFKMPRFGVTMPKVSGPEIDFSLSKKDGEVTLPEGKAEVKLPDVELKGPSVDVETKDTEIKVGSKEGDAKLKKRFSLPKFSFSKQSSKDSGADISLPDVDVSLPEANVEVKHPELRYKQPEGNVELDGQESKFKMPQFGISMPRVKGPEIDFSISKKDVDVTLPEAKAEVQLRDVKIKQKSSKVEVEAPEIEAQTHLEGSPSRFKMPTFTLPKFGVSTPKVSMEVPDVESDIKLDGAKMEVTKGATVDIKAPSIETEGISVDVKAKGSEIEGSGGKFKMPRFGISMPKFEGPEIDLSISRKDVDVTLPEAQAEVKLPHVEVKAPEVAISVPDAPTVEVEAKSKQTSWSFPKFSLSRTGGKAPDVDVNIEKSNVDVQLPEAKAEVSLPDVEVQGTVGAISMDEPRAAELDANLKKSKFSLPRFSFSKSSGKGPEVSAELPDVDVCLPEGNLEVKQYDVQLQQPVGNVELDGQESKFKMPTFGISMPRVKGPEIDFSISKKDVDVTLPEAKAEVQLPDVKLKQTFSKAEVEAPEIEAQTHLEGSPSRFKMPTFTLPRFGASTPKVSMEVPDVESDIKVDGAKMEVTKGATVDIKAPSIETEGISVDVKAKGSEIEGSGGKFKFPKFGISMPKFEGPEIDFSISRKDVDVTLPEAQSEVKLPHVEVKAPEVAISVPDAPTVEVEAKSKQSSWSFPKFSLSMTGGKAPDVDVNIEKSNVDVQLPEAKAEVSLPDVEVQGTAGAISMDEPPAAELDANLKKSKFSLPRFSFSKSSGKGPEVSAELPDVDVSLPEGNLEVKQSDVQLQQPEGNVELDGQEGKFKMPMFGISMPRVKGPEIDFSISKKDVDVTLPEAKAEVQLPDVKIKQKSSKVEVEAPEIEAQTHLEGSPSRFKMPTFTLPKFGVSTPKVSMEVPDVESDIKVDGAKMEVTKGATVDIKAPSIETEGISVDVKAKGSEIEGSGGKFKMPRFGISMPKFEGPEIDLSISRKDVDVTIPEAQAEVKLPHVEVKAPEVAISVPDAPTVEVEAKSKQSSWSFPKFSLSRTGGKAPDVDVNIEKSNVDVQLPEAKAEVSLPDVEVQGTAGAISMDEPPAAELDANLKKSKFSLPRFSFSKSSGKGPEVSAELPDVDVSLPEGNLEVKQSDVQLQQPEGNVELDGQESKFKMPMFGISMPRVKGPEIDFSISKKDVDVTLPEAKAEVQLPDVKIKQKSSKVEVEAPEIEAQTHLEGSPSRFKMPTFTLPKFGASTPKVSMEVPDVESDIKVDGAKMEVTKGATVDIKAPSIETEGISVDVKAKGSEIEGSGGKFKMPRFGISMPKFEGPEIDLSISRKDVDVTLPEAQAEVKLPHVEVKAPEVAISVPDAPTVEVEAKSKQSTWSFPKFSLSRTGGKAPDVDVNIEKSNVDVQLPEAKAEVSLPDVEVQGTVGAISMDEPPAAELDANLKKSKFSLPRFSFSKSSGKGPEMSIEIPAEGEVQVKQPEMKTTKTPEFEAEHDKNDSGSLGSPSKFQLPSFKMPSMSFSRAKPEDEYASVETECIDGQLDAEVESKGESKSPKTSFSFGNMLKGFDLELDVSTKDKVEQNLATSEVVNETDGSSGKQLEAKEKETNAKQDATKSPERTGWFKFSKFGMSSPSEPAKTPEKEKVEKSPMGDEEISPTCSVQSSEAFADISSAMTSEHVGFSSSSPTKVTVKYSDPNASTAFGELHSNIITSTTRTKLISAEPNLPEKITILSSGLSSSSEDTTRLESGKIHVITSNIQATPEAQQPTLFTAVQVQPAGGLSLKSEANEAASWTVEDSQNGKRSVFERHVVRETSSGRSEGKETIVVTKQVTRIFDSSEATASSIQRLRDTVHTEKMRFFEEDDK